MYLTLPTITHTPPCTVPASIIQYQSSPRKTDPTAPYSVSPVSKSRLALSPRSNGGLVVTCTCTFPLPPSPSSKLLLSPRRVTRKISKTPFKVLDAPDLQDDFYLNLLDWSAQNLLAVGLGTAVYLWSACTCQVRHVHACTCTYCFYMCINYTASVSIESLSV